ncbi:hypothetical protein N7481_008737 [Penicillium waksmanii]|uniref:uncharacterized protein n=1 Tax=Penicillium waksmanii TaxID=69791 RepID=UPI002548A5C6|nr:uncharacterized protein N7481_008737 [Penicillium waksmanii]KAJ5975030.1 hypothetical protein N7481_008737 [Penicillium waksmanii]
MSSFFLAFCLWQATAAAVKTNLNTVCATGCQTTVSNIGFSGISALEDYYGSLCGNVLQVKSTFNCMREYCSDNGLLDGWNGLNQVCEEDGGMELLPWSIIDNVTEAEVKSWPTLTYEDTQLGAEFSTPVSVDQGLFQIGYQTIFDWENQRTKRHNYGYAIVGFWGLIVLFGTMHNFIRYLMDSSILRSKKVARCQGFIGRYLAVPPILITRKKNRIFSMPSTPRLQAIIISIYFIISIVLMCVDYHAFSENLYFTKKSTQLWRYIGDRAGALVINNLPVMWLFATRNNLLLWVTRWDFATFNTFHRWIGRACAIEIFLHGMAVCIYQYKELGTEYFLPLWKDVDWYMGVVAACSIILTTLLASAPIRKSVYDLFLIVHQSFAVACLVGLWYHLPVDGPDYVNFIWPCIAIWSFDRLVRIVRLLTWNKFASYSSAEYNRDADVIQLRTRVRRIASPRPGSYYYVYGWRSLKFWENHPFTLSGWNTVKTTDESYTELIFLISVQSGFTSRLRSQLLNHEKSEIDASSTARKSCISVEGPYGSHFCPWHSETALFVIGGAGITVATSFMQDLVDLVQSGKHTDQRIKRVKIVWAVKNPTFYQFVYERYMVTWEAVFASTDIELSLDVYLTIPSKMDSDDEMSLPELRAGPNESTKNMDTVVSPSSSSNSNIATEKVPSEEVPTNAGRGTLKTTFVQGRPMINDVIRSQIEALRLSGEKQLALVGCGPATMAHDIRLSFVESSNDAQVAVDFHLAPFGW